MSANKYIPRINLQWYLKHGFVKDCTSRFIISNTSTTEEKEEKLVEYMIQNLVKVWRSCKLVNCVMTMP